MNRKDPTPPKSQEREPPRTNNDGTPRRVGYQADQSKRSRNERTNERTKHTKERKEGGNSHGALLMLPGLPIGVGHGELVEIREQWGDHRVRRAVDDPTRVPARAVRRRRRLLSHGRGWIQRRAETTRVHRRLNALPTPVYLHTSVPVSVRSGAAIYREERETHTHERTNVLAEINVNVTTGGKEGEVARKGIRGYWRSRSTRTHTHSPTHAEERGGGEEEKAWNLETRRERTRGGRLSICSRIKIK